MARRCFYIPPDAYVEGHGFIPSMVTEGEPGHVPLAGNGQFAQPWYWGHTIEKAREIAAKENERLGLSPDDVATIIASSFGANTGERWMVVDKNRTPIHTGMLRRENADSEAARLNEEGLSEFAPYRVVADTVATDLNS
jgi:hypothetical protein